MPKRVIDFDAMWGSDKLAACAAWAQAEYAWLYGLADASGCFELTNLRVIWGRVAAIRKNLTIERLEQILDEFQDKGLLFVWEHEGKRYGHWTGSDVPGRLPPPSWRIRFERFAPPVPKQQLAAYTSRFARGRATLMAAVFHGEDHPECADRSQNFKFEIANGKMRQEALRSQGGGLKDGLEAAQAQDLDWDLNRNGNRKTRESALGEARVCGEGGIHKGEPFNSDSFHLNSNSDSNRSSDIGRQFGDATRQKPNSASPAQAGTRMGHLGGSEHLQEAASVASRDKALAVERELRVGRGPACEPGRVKPEVLERARLREAARAGSRPP